MGPVRELFHTDLSLAAAAFQPSLTLLMLHWFDLCTSLNFKLLWEILAHLSSLKWPCICGHFKHILRGFLCSDVIPHLMRGILFRAWSGFTVAIGPATGPETLQPRLSWSFTVIIFAGLNSVFAAKCEHLIHRVNSTGVWWKTDMHLETLSHY